MCIYKTSSNQAPSNYLSHATSIAQKQDVYILPRLRNDQVRINCLNRTKKVWRYELISKLARKGVGKGKFKQILWWWAALKPTWSCQVPVMIVSCKQQLCGAITPHQGPSTWLASRARDSSLPISIATFTQWLTCSSSLCVNLGYSCKCICNPDVFPKAFSFGQKYPKSRWVNTGPSCRLSPCLWCPYISGPASARLWPRTCFYCANAGAGPFQLPLSQHTPSLPSPVPVWHCCSWRTQGNPPGVLGTWAILGFESYLWGLAPSLQRLPTFSYIIPISWI